jgi:hypothetical protein
MLNISDNNKTSSPNLEKFKIKKKLQFKFKFKDSKQNIISVCIIGVLILFLPWTQNISGSRTVTTLIKDRSPYKVLFRDE